METINTRQFSRTLRKWIYSKGYETIHAFIRETEMENTKVYQYTTGRNLPSLPVALRLAQALDITVEQLISGPEDEKHAKD